MIRAAIVGSGWWGPNLVTSVSGSELIRFTTVHTGTQATAVAFCAEAGLRWVGSLDAPLTDDAIDAVANSAGLRTGGVSGSPGGG